MDERQKRISDICKSKSLPSEEDLVLKGSRRSRMKKGLKSIPQQAKDYANIRGSDKEVPSKISTWTLIILSVIIMMVPMKNTQEGWNECWQGDQQ